MDDQVGDVPMRLRKKLIETALPLEVINHAAAADRFIRHGHPSTFHTWWSRKPLAAARALLFAQMVDDPASIPEEFPSTEEQERERRRLFHLLESMLPWEAVSDAGILEQGRREIWKSWRRACHDNRDHPLAAQIFNPAVLPAFHDPFAGGGAIPLEAGRLGLEVFASDLNPVAVLICKATLDLPRKLWGKAPVNPVGDQTFAGNGLEGLAQDIKFYGDWLLAQATERLSGLYPKIEITKELCRDHSELGPLIGTSAKVIAWIWARTVKSPNPAYAHVDVPLVSNFMLSTKPGKEAFVEALINGDDYKFVVRTGLPADINVTSTGTKLGRANFRCILSGAPVTRDYIKDQGTSGHLCSRLMAIAIEGPQGRAYLSPSAVQNNESNGDMSWYPQGSLPEDGRAFTPYLYGLDDWKDLFTARQLKCLTTLVDLIPMVKEKVLADQHVDSSAEALAYAEAIATYLSLAISRFANCSSTICNWNPQKEAVRFTFSRQALPMTWEFVETNPFGESAGNFPDNFRTWIPKVLLHLPPTVAPALSTQADAAAQNLSSGKVVSTDPPYYSNIGYADLADFFYVWLRPMLRPIYPDLFSTVAVPKAEELVASPTRHGGRRAADAFFLAGMSRALTQIATQGHPAFPITIYYAYKQSESPGDGNDSMTGWVTFLDALMRAGLGISGTWPIRTEMTNRMRGNDSNALASSIVLVCRRLARNAPSITRREFLAQLKRELPAALHHLREGNIALVDLQQASIGPGMDVFTRYAKVIDSAGQAMSVRDALIAINQTLDELVAEREGDLDRETQWALAWFDHAGFAEGEFGVAENLSKAKNTSVSGLDKSGLIEARAGKVRLLKPEELPAKWDPAGARTSWEILHHLIRVHDGQGEEATAALVKKLGNRVEFVPDLCLGLHRTCEQKKRATEALWYNSLGQSWHEICRLAQEDAESQGRLEF